LCAKYWALIPPDGSLNNEEIAHQSFAALMLLDRDNLLIPKEITSPINLDEDQSEIILQQMNGFLSSVLPLDQIDAAEGYNPWLYSSGSGEYEVN
jgi:hypothetical protein